MNISTKLSRIGKTVGDSFCENFKNLWSSFKTYVWCLSSTCMTIFWKREQLWNRWTAPLPRSIMA